MRTPIGMALLLAVIATSCASQPQNRAKDEIDVGTSSPTDEMDRHLSVLTNKIVESMTETKRTRIAVVEFVGLDGKVTHLGRFLAEELATRLFLTKRFHVIERSLLNKVLEEHKLELMGFVDSDAAMKLGKLVGAEVIASGTITTLANSVRINARLIGTETGDVFAAAAVEIPKDVSVERLIRGQDAKLLERSVSSEPTEGPSSFSWNEWKRGENEFLGHWELVGDTLIGESSKMAKGKGDWTFLTYRRPVRKYEVSAKIFVDIVGHRQSVVGFSFGSYRDWCLSLATGRWYALKLSVRGNHVAMTIDESIVREEDVNYATDQFQLKLWSARAYFTSLKVVPLN
jgi:TolB-like protein